MSRSEALLKVLGKALARTLKRFRRGEGAVALVEFALIVPLLLFLYLGSTELSQMITIDRRVTNVAATMGDLVARANATLARADLNDYFVASEKIMLPFGSTDLKQTLSMVFVDNTGVAKVVWSEVRHGAKALTVGQVYKLPAETVAIAKGSNVIVSEAAYSYEPMFGLVFKSAVQFYRRNFFLPRFGEAITIPAT
jgi:Flp pilus assembly protein TadG